MLERTFFISLLRLLHVGAIIATCKYRTQLEISHMDNTLKSGYGLYRAKGKVQHAGTYWKEGLVVEHGPKGVRVVSLEEFADGQDVRVLYTEVELDVLEQRIQIVLGEERKYDFMFDNCEHVANYLRMGAKVSEQASLGFLGGCLGLAVARSLGGGAFGQLAGLAVGAYAGHTFACSKITSKSRSFESIPTA